MYALVVNKGGPKFQESAEAGGLIRKMGRGTLKGQAVKLEMLALNLSNELGRRVIDKTGLGGKYDFELNWEPRPAAGTRSIRRSRWPLTSSPHSKSNSGLPSRASAKVPSKFSSSTARRDPPGTEVRDLRELSRDPHRKFGPSTNLLAPVRSRRIRFGRAPR